MTSASRKADYANHSAAIHPAHVRLGYLSGNCSICSELRKVRDRAEDAKHVKSTEGELRADWGNR